MNAPFLSSLIRMRRRRTHDYDEDLFNAILASPLLIEEDAHFISFYYNNHIHHKGCVRNGINRDLLVRSSVVLCSAIVLANVSVPNWIRLPLYLLPCGILLDTLKKSFQHPKVRQLEQTKRFLKVTDDLQVLIKNCLKFIQEMEIASLGYTLACGNSTVSRLQRIRQSRTGKCFDLRYSVLNTCIRMINAHREASHELLQLSTDGTKLNAVLCEIPCDELGPCFVKNCSFEDVCSSSDDLCLQFLRDTSCFMQLQQSEYLKLFVLSQYKSMEDAVLVQLSTKRAWSESNVGKKLTGLKNKASLPCSPINERPFLMMEELSISCENQLESLRNVYKIHQNVSKPLRNGKEEVRKNVVGESATRKAIHSIQVHLRAALEIAIQSEAQFVGCEDTSDISNVLLPQLLVHLEASNDCVSETLRCLSKEAEMEKQLSESKPSQPTPEIVNAPINTVVDSSLLEKNDFYFEDQVFEAIVEESEPADDQDASNITESEDSRRKRIEETRHVMRELKSVLHVKTSVEEREIRKSKLFPQYIPKQVESVSLVSVTGNAKGYSLDRAPTIDKNTSDGCDDTDGEKKYSADGEMHEMLPVPRRPKIPRPSSRRRTKHITSAASDRDTVEGDLNPECKSNNLSGTGIGFSSSLAHQVISAAQAKSVMPGWRMAEEATFGESDSDS